MTAAHWVAAQTPARTMASTMRIWPINNLVGVTDLLPPAGLDRFERVQESAKAFQKDMVQIGPDRLNSDAIYGFTRSSSDRSGHRSFRQRSEERRVGEAWGSPCRSRWSAVH